MDIFKPHFGKDPTSKYHCGNANMETGFIFVYFVFNKHLWVSCVQGIVPPTDLLFHLLGQLFHRDKLPGLEAQQVQNETCLAPKPVPPPVFLISVNDITILPNVQAPTFGIISAFSSSVTAPYISHQLSNPIVFPIYPLFFHLIFLLSSCPIC